MLLSRSCCLASGCLSLSQPLFHVIKGPETISGSSPGKAGASPAFPRKKKRRLRKRSMKQKRSQAADVVRKKKK